MCLAYPGTVIKIQGSSATVSYLHCDSTLDVAIHLVTTCHCEERSGEATSQHMTTKQVLLGDEKVKKGDKVLVQMGIVIKVLSEEENKNILESWSSL